MAGVGGLQSLPQHLWCLVSQYHGVSDSAATMQGSLWLRRVFDEDALWHCHAVATCVAQAAQASAWVCPWPFQTPLCKCLNWRSLLRLNAKSRGKPVAWIRVSQTDLRVPLDTPAEDNAGVLLAKLARLLSGNRRLPAEGGGGGSLDCLPLAWPMRARELLWGGRPGAVVPQEAGLSGARVMVEWAHPDWRRWPLPPHGPSAAAQAAGPSTGREALVRVLSPHLHGEAWVLVNLFGTVGELCGNVARVFRQGCELFADAERLVEVRLVDAVNAQRARPANMTLRDLGWARSETVWAHVEGKPTAEVGAAATWVVWISREPAFAPVASPVGSRPGDCPVAEAAPCDRLQLEGAVRMARGAPVLPLSGVAEGRQRAAGAAQQPECTTADTGFWSIFTQCLRSPVAACEDVVDLHPELGPCSPDDCSISFCDDVPSREGPGTVWERVVPHSQPRVLWQTGRARQFEFHPSMAELVLVGDKDGNVNVMDIEQAGARPPLHVGHSAVLGLAWLRQDPQVVACGLSQTGEIHLLKYNPHAPAREPVLSARHRMEAFPKLSSISVNCSDDFLLASGISTDVAIYDVQTGRVLQRAHGLHEQLVNLSRFSHTSPHVFATASFDNTCKVWDLRQPLLSDRPLKSLGTPGHNVMCAFSPDDRYILCSGVDTNLTQFEVPSWRRSPEHFPLREPRHSDRYRRVAYLADSRHFVTAATEESHAHILSAQGGKLGVVEFRGLLQGCPGSGVVHWPERVAQCWGPHAGGPGSWPPLGCGSPSAAQQRSPRCHSASPLLHGAVRIDDADPRRSNDEFIQSLRAHPSQVNRIGVLLSLRRANTAYLAIADLHTR